MTTCECTDCGTDFAVHQYFWPAQNIDVDLCDGCVQLSGIGPELLDECNMVDGVRVADCREGENA